MSCSLFWRGTVKILCFKEKRCHTCRENISKTSIILKFMKNEKEIYKVKLI